MPEDTAATGARVTIGENFFVLGIVQVPGRADNFTNKAGVKYMYFLSHTCMDKDPHAH